MDDGASLADKSKEILDTAAYDVRAPLCLQRTVRARVRQVCKHCDDWLPLEPIELQPVVVAL